MRTAAFVDFLQTFKSSSTEAADQLEALNINGDGDSDEYDMVDDGDDPRTEARRNRHGKMKYMQILQDVADRVKSEIVIDLNDLEAVGRSVRQARTMLISKSTKRPIQTTSTSLS